VDKIFYLVVLSVLVLTLIAVAIAYAQNGGNIRYFSITDGFTNYREYTNVLSHEIVETLADPPQPDGAKGFAVVGGHGDQISDVCEQENILLGDDLYVHSYWSNARAGCVAPPVLMGSGTPTDDIVKVEDRGGQIMQNAVVYIVFWGSSWNTMTMSEPTKKGIEDRIKLLLTKYSTYFSELQQYRNIKPPKYGGSYVNTITPVTKTYDENLVGKVVQDAIAAKIVPNLPNALYLIVPEVGVKNKDGFDGFSGYFQ
jgi:hypothetical protein